MIYIILVGLGGGLGALARYSTGVYIGFVFAGIRIQSF